MPSAEALGDWFACTQLEVACGASRWFGRAEGAYRLGVGQHDTVSSLCIGCHAQNRVQGAVASACQHRATDVCNPPQPEGFVCGVCVRWAWAVCWGERYLVCGLGICGRPSHAEICCGCGTLVSLAAPGAAG
jgi:hypothetical protein